MGSRVARLWRASTLRRPVLRLVVGVVLMTPALVGLARNDATGSAELDPAITVSTRVSARFAHDYGIPLELAHRIHVSAVAEGIAPGIAFRLIEVESGFRRDVISVAGAIGYTQLLPTTARWISPGTDRQALFDPDTNLRIGFRYLRYLLDRYDGDARLALTAYNRGPGTVDRLRSRGHDPENGYAARILRLRV
ncbi:MAG: lytic transglycosylase domain-containing protein [Longimicrobiales bacterium]